MRRPSRSTPAHPRPGSAAGGGPSGRARAGRRRGLAIAAGAILAVALAAGWLTRAPRAPRATATPPPAPHPALALDAAPSYVRGRDLVRRGRSVEALPYFERATTLRPDVWEGQVDLASALFNSSFEAATRRGRLATWTRSSFERAVLARRVWERLEIAGRVASDPGELGYVHELRGRLLGAWGMPQDARLAYADALMLDPSARVSAAASRQLAIALGFAPPPRGGGR
jgi:hypothetical protein